MRHADLGTLAGEAEALRAQLAQEHRPASPDRRR